MSSRSAVWVYAGLSAVTSYATLTASATVSGVTANEWRENSRYLVRGYAYQGLHADWFWEDEQVASDVASARRAAGRLENEINRPPPARVMMDEADQRTREKQKAEFMRCPEDPMITADRRLIDLWGWY